MICADVAHILHFPASELRKERWSSLLLWHAEAHRIGKAIGIEMGTVK